MSDNRIDPCGPVDVAEHDVGNPDCDYAPAEVPQEVAALQAARAAERAWDECLAVVVSGIESALSTVRQRAPEDAESGIQALRGLIDAVPKTPNPYRDSLGSGMQTS